METDPTVALYKFIPWFQANRKLVVAVGVGVVAIAIVIAYSSWSKEQNETAANLDLMSIPALLVPNPDNPHEAPSATKLLAVAQDHPGTSAAAVAQILGGRSLFLDGKYPEAQAAFAKFLADYPNSPMVPQAKVCVAECMEAQGKVNEAIQEYKAINTLFANVPNIVMPVKLTLGRLSEAEKPAQSVNYYNELASSKDMRDPWVAEATERLRLLLAKHPELNPNAQQPPQPGVTAPSVLAPSSTEMQMTAPPNGGTMPATTNGTAPK